MRAIVHAENLEALRLLPSEAVELCYVDPPFNTGRRQRLERLRTERVDGSERGGDAGDRTGFGGRRYRSVKLGSRSFADRFDDYLAFLEPRLVETWRVLAPTGSLFVHLDWREVHYVKVMLDALFGRDRFRNEIVWAYDYGARSRTRWSPKHDTILWYSKHPREFTFHFDAMERIPYMAPGLVGPEKAARGKTPTDVWWHTIVAPSAKERTGYPTQKPLGVLERIVKVHSSPGDLVLDHFAGSGTTGEAAARHGRDFLLVDDSPEAVAVMRARLAPFEPELVGAEELSARLAGRASARTGAG